MTDSSKEPSKGAMRAAQATLNIIDERITFFAYEKEKPKNLGIVAEVIDRETKAGEMADLLRESLDVIIEELAAAGPDEVRSHPTLKRHSQTAAKIERLLTDLYPNEEKGQS